VAQAALASSGTPTTLCSSCRTFSTRSQQENAAELKLDPAALDRCMKDEGLADVKNDIEVGSPSSWRVRRASWSTGRCTWQPSRSVLESLRVAPTLSSSSQELPLQRAHATGLAGTMVIVPNKWHSP